MVQTRDDRHGLLVSMPRRKQLPDDFDEVVGQAWLGDYKVEASVERLVTSLLKCVSSEGDDGYLVERRIGAQLQHCLSTSHAWHAEVHQYDIGSLFARKRDSIKTVARTEYVKPLERQIRAVNLQRVGEVIDYEHLRRPWNHAVDRIADAVRGKREFFCS